jgi:hypothetical protein
MIRYSIKLALPIKPALRVRLNIRCYQNGQREKTARPTSAYFSSEVCVWDGHSASYRRRHGKVAGKSVRAGGWSGSRCSRRRQFACCYKTYAVGDGGRWLLWYNSRRESLGQIGMAVFDGERFWGEGDAARPRNAWQRQLGPFTILAKDATIDLAARYKAG